MEKGGYLGAGLVVGSLIGTVIGVLYAPKSGKETREEISRKADELVTKAKEEYEWATEKSRKAYVAAVKHLMPMEQREEMNGQVEERASQEGAMLQ